LGTNSQTTLVDATFEYAKGVFNSGSSQRLLSIQNSTFRHLMIESTSFFALTGVSITGDRLGENIIKNCTFENISSIHSIFLVQNNGIRLTLDSVSMNDLKKIESSDPDDLQFGTQWPGGLCALLTTEASLTVNKSNFTNINGHCFGTKFSAVNIEDSLFDNTNLDETPITIEDTTINSLDIYSGTSWVNIDDLGQVSTFGYQAIFKRNTFMTNKRVPLYGGVIIHHYKLLIKLLGN